MKLKKNVKRKIIILLVMIIAAVGGYFAYKEILSKDTTKEVKVIDNISKYGYNLKENKPKKYKDMFNELKKILSEKEVDEEKYVSKISEMFIYDFYSLDDKAAKTDIGGVDFVYNGIIDNFLQNAQNTYYKYVESNIYNNRKQKLPTVDKIEIKDISQKAFAYGSETDDKAFFVEIEWTYTDENYSDYQNKATLVFIHDGIKLSLVELQ